MARHPWSKVQRAVCINVVPGINFQLQCKVYRMDRAAHSYGSYHVPRYWATLGKEIIWDYPRQFVDEAGHSWVYFTKISQISDVIREYLDTPRENILSAEFPDDHWGIVNILRVADVRIGRQRWDLLERAADSEAVSNFLAARRIKLRKVEQKVCSAKHSCVTTPFFSI